MTRQFGSLPLVISGKLTATYEKKIRPPILFKRSFSEVMEFINEMK
jgi:hypothetical protein